MQLFFISLLRAAFSVNSRTLPAAVAAAEQHRGLRAGAFGTRTALKAKKYLTLRELPRLINTHYTSDATRREQSSVYKHWLSGAEGRAKRTQQGYTPMSRSRYTENASINFGRRRLRFPASGRRRKSFDSLLHAFAKKVSPARLRRASKLKFSHIRVKLAGDFKENALVFTPMFGSLRRRRTMRNLSTATYLSDTWRALLEQRAVSKKLLLTPPAALAGKRRFLALPTHRVFAYRRRGARRLRVPYKRPMHALRVSLLRRALRMRRKERVFMDLRHSLLHRKLPKEKATNFRQL
jgi:hypothetical protein